MSDAPIEPVPDGLEPRRSRIPASARKAVTKGAAVTERGRLWIENQPPDSRKGATVGWVRRYQAADGQLYAVLLSAYVLLTMVPVILVAASYIYKDPTALAHRIEHRLRLHGTTAALFSSVMLGAGEHKLSGALIAIVNVFFFGLGFARVLQLAHARSWGIDLRKSAIVDQARYAEVLGAMVLGAILFVFQDKELQDSRPGWAWCSTSAGSRFCSPSSSGRRVSSSITASLRAISSPVRSSPCSGSSACGSSRCYCSRTG